MTPLSNRLNTTARYLILLYAVFFFGFTANGPFEAHRFFVGLFPLAVVTVLLLGYVIFDYSRDLKSYKQFLKMRETLKAEFTKYENSQEELKCAISAQLKREHNAVME